VTSSETAGICARNNALWCDAVLTAAGASTEFHNGFWIAEGKQLPLYPNLITLQPGRSADLDAALSTLPKNAGLKDSFDCLDLAPLGFEKLFTGTWLFRAAATVRKPPAPPGWHKAMTPDGLRSWCAAWSANDSLHAVFPAPLLENPAIEFASIVRDGTIQSGAVFNSGPQLENRDVLGLSNLFHRKNWRYSALHGLLAPYPHRALCTYETDAALLPVYRQLGFHDTGSLSVWLKS